MAKLIVHGRCIRALCKTQTHGKHVTVGYIRYFQDGAKLVKVQTDNKRAAWRITARKMRLSEVAMETVELIKEGWMEYTP